MQHKRQVASAIVTLVVIALVMIAAPAQAVLLKVVKLPNKANTGSSVGFELGANLQGKDQIPIDNITLTLSGPENITCVFTPNGTVISGCDGLSIAPDLVTAEFFDELYGFGWNGTKHTGTDFGYGFGYESATGHYANQELTWNVVWNTTGRPEGVYEVTFSLQGVGSAGAGTYSVKENPNIELVAEKAKSKSDIAASVQEEPSTKLQNSGAELAEDKPAKPSNGAANSAKKK